MKTIRILLAVLVLMVALPVVGQKRPQVNRQTYTISPNTTKITYKRHTNSGIAIYTTYVITTDSLVWQYHEARNGCFLTDVCRYERRDFDALLKSMESLSITMSTKPYRPGYGGSGWSYSFADAEKNYLYYGKGSEIAGDNKEIESLIQNFIHNHMTEAQLLFNKLRSEPHERGEFGTFKELPEVLKMYSKR